MTDRKATSASPLSHEVVNVASVRHLSPFRYPGGKTWLVPRIRTWLSTLPSAPARFIEPFAGGAIVGLTVARAKLVKRVTLVEIDEDVGAVWRVVISGEGDVQALARRIKLFEMTEETVDRELSREPQSLEDRAFQTILRNRISHGGILAPGAGRLKNGENNRGISSRWYPETLHDRILNILSFRDRIEFIQGDGLRIIDEKSSDENAVFFIDPPYTAGTSETGSRLYTHSALDHGVLFEKAQRIRGDVLMTYSDDAYVRRLAREHGFEYEPIAMKTTHHVKKTELLVGRDLDWARKADG